MPSMRSISIVFIAMALAAPLAQPSTGCTVAGVDLALALAAAQANPARCLDIPAGEYMLSGAGVLLSANADSLTIGGAGIGKTVLRVSGPLTLTQDLIVLRLNGAQQRVHDLTIQIDDAAMSGPWGTNGISIYASAHHATIERVEIVGGYSGDGARGFGIGTYRPATIEGGAQYATIRDCIIRDGRATGIVINSSHNTVTGNHIARVGLNHLSHGIYMQGGYNLYQGNTIERVSGYSFHAWKMVPGIDASGDRVIGNTSIDPTWSHVVVQGLSNPPLTRSIVISENVFRSPVGHTRSSGVIAAAPATITANVFENVGWDGGDVIKAASAGVIVAHNRISNPQQPTTYAINVTAPAVVEGNVIEGVDTTLHGIIVAGASAGALISNNRIAVGRANGSGVLIAAHDVLVIGNVFSVASGVGVSVGEWRAVVRDNLILLTAPAKAYSASTALTADLGGNVVRP